MTRITMEELCAALHCSERNIRAREGTTLPDHLPELSPRQYALEAVLWTVGGTERERICAAAGLSAEGLREAMFAYVHDRAMTLPEFEASQDLLLM